MKRRAGGKGTFVLRMLFAVFAFAVGLSSLGNVDLWEVVSHAEIQNVPFQAKPQEILAVIQQPLSGTKPREERGRFCAAWSPSFHLLMLFEAYESDFVRNSSDAQYVLPISDDVVVIFERYGRASR